MPVEKMINSGSGEAMSACRRSSWTLETRHHPRHRVPPHQPSAGDYCFDPQTIPSFVLHSLTSPGVSERIVRRAKDPRVTVLFAISNNRSSLNPSRPPLSDSTPQRPLSSLFVSLIGVPGARRIVATCEKQHLVPSLQSGRRGGGEAG